MHATIVTVEPPITDSPYYGNLHNADKRPQSRIIPYSLLHIATSVKQKLPYSELRTLKSHPNRQNQYKFPSESRQSTYWCKRIEKYLLFLKTSHFYPFFNISRPSLHSKRAHADQAFEYVTCSSRSN